MNIVERYHNNDTNTCMAIENPYNKRWTVCLKGDKWPKISPDHVIANLYGLTIKGYIDIGEKFFQGKFSDDELTFYNKLHAERFIGYLNRRAYK